MNKSTFLAALVAIVASGSSVAQNAPATVELRALAFSPDLKVKDAYLHDPAAPAEAAAVKTEIKSYLNHQFSPMVLRSRKVVITTSSDRASMTKPGELIGEATLPADGDSSILLFLPGKPGANAKCQVMAVPDSKKAFPAGSFRVTNLSPLHVRLVMEKKVYDFLPGKTGLVENPPVRPNGQIGMRAVAQKEGKWVELSSSLWAHPGEARCFMIIFPDEAAGGIRLQAFDDIKPRTPTEPGVPTP